MDLSSIAASDGQLTVSNTRLQAKQNRYMRFLESLKGLESSRDPKVKAAVKQSNDAMREKFLVPGNVHIDSALSNVSIQYANEEYIGLELMPAVSVPKLSDIYFIYDKRNRLAYPDDYMGQRSSANELTESRSQGTYSCRPYAYKNYIDALTLFNQDAPLNEMIDLTAATVEAIAFRRELRIASIMTSTASYPAGNTVSLAAGVRWDTAGGGNPVKDIQTAVAALWSGRGPGKKVGWCDLDTWNTLARHPMILDLFKYNGSSPGLATPSMLAPWFGIDEILVAKARKDTANEAQTAAYSRIWGNGFGVCRVALNPGLRNAAFGYTLRAGQVATDEWFDQSVGTNGGYYARVSTKEDHKIIAGDTGYFIGTPIG